MTAQEKAAIVAGNQEVTQLILARLDKLEDKIDLARIDIAGLKVKASLWGFLAGLIPPMIGLTMWALSVAT